MFVMALNFVVPVAKYPDHPDAIKLLQMQDTFLRMDQQWETAVKVIEKLLDPGQPFLKKIVEEGKEVTC